jgi:hypothetical protein
MLVVCNGLPKSASSFVFQLTRDICEAAGHLQAPLIELIPPQLVPYKPQPYFVQLDDDGMERLLDAVPPHAFLVVKSHGRLTSKLGKALDEGKLLGITSVRDPRDAIVSLIDAGFREKRRPPALRRFTIETHDQAINSIYEQYSWVREWSSHPAILTIDFTQSTGFPFETADNIASHLGFDLNVFAIVKSYLRSKDKILEFSSGLSGRYRSVLTLEEEKKCERLFGSTSYSN